MSLVDEVAQQLRDLNSESPDNFEVMAAAMVERFAPEPELPEFMVGHELSFLKDIDKQEYVHENHHTAVETPDEANLISSKVKGKQKHKVILDLDFDAALIPSSTPKHWHLYLDKELGKEEMGELLYALHKAGIIAQGNLNQWDKFKAQFLRLPWIHKGEDATEDNDSPKD